MSRVNQRDVMEERQKRWMEGRRKEQFSKTSDSNRELPSTIDSIPLNVPTSSAKRFMESKTDNGSIVRPLTGDTSEELLVQKLTEKMAGRIREEIHREMKGSLHNSDIRDAVADKMDSFLNAELHTHTCKLCSQLMVGPNNTPMILFPCGHTFCASCVPKHRSSSSISGGSVSSSNRSSLCPYCRYIPYPVTDPLSTLFYLFIYFNYFITDQYGCQ